MVSNVSKYIKDTMIMPFSILMKVLVKSRNFIEFTLKEWILLTAQILMCFRSNGKIISTARLMLFIYTFQSHFRFLRLFYFNMSCEIQKLEMWLWKGSNHHLMHTTRNCSTTTTENRHSNLIDPIASFYLILIEKKYIPKYFISSRILRIK